jgi:hypothetical protein
MLGVNDGEVRDNGGFFSVVVDVERGCVATLHQHEGHKGHRGKTYSFLCVHRVLCV